MKAREGGEEREPCHTVGGSADWCRHHGEQCGAALKLKTEFPCDPTFPPLAYIQRKVIEKTHATLCSLQRNLQQVRHESHLRVHDRWMGKCGVYLYSGIVFSHKNEMMLFVAKMMGLEVIILSDVSQRKTNIWYHLYVEPKKCHMHELIYKIE